MEGPFSKGCEWSLGVESDFQLTARKKTGPQSFSHKNLNSSKSLNNLETGFFLRAPQKECNSADTLRSKPMIVQPHSGKWELCQTLKYRLVSWNECCFELLSGGVICYTAAANSYCSLFSHSKVRDISVVYSLRQLRTKPDKHFYPELKFSFHKGKYLGTGYLGCLVSICLTL